MGEADGLLRAMEYLKDSLTKPLVKEVAAALVRRTDPSPLPLAAMGHVMRLCLEHADDWEGVAAVAVGVTCYYPPSAGHWLEILLEPLTEKNWEFSYGFAFGAILGFFESGLWLCHNWRLLSESFWREWPSLWQNLVFSRELASLSPEGQEIRFPNSAYPGRLSNAARSFLSDPKNPDEERLYKCFRICDEVWHRETKDDEITPMGRLLLDHLTYYIFGQLSATSRANVLSVWHRQMLEDARRHAANSQTG